MDKSLENLLKDKNFVKKILAMETPEEVQHSFKENKINFSVDEIKLIGKLVNEYVEKTRSLPESELSKISAGTIGDFIKGAGVGTLDAIPGGGIAYKIFSGYNGGVETSAIEGTDSKDVGYHVGKELTHAVEAAGLITAATIFAYKKPQTIKWAVDKVTSFGSGIAKKIKTKIKK